MTNHLNGLDAGSGPQTTIFPNDAKPLGYGVDTVNADAVEEARQAVARRVNSDELRTLPYRSWLILGGCVTYSSRSTPKPHQTSFAFYVWHQPPGSKPGTQDLFTLTMPGTIVSDEITTSEAGSGDIID